MGQAWRLLRSGYGTGRFNMALDEYLLNGMVPSQGRPVLRFYRWSPAAVSCGFGQKLEREVDLGKCRRAGIDVVRRPTGGRAVLHWDELTYCLVWPLNEPGLDGTISDTYRRISECLAAGLRLFGLETELEKNQNRSERNKGRIASPPCFSSTARWELKHRGRKLVGSAQRRIGQAVLQHGSLLLGPKHLLLAELLSESPTSTDSVLARHLERSSTWLQQCVDGEIHVDKLEDCLVEGFRHKLGIRLQEDILTLHEQQAVQAVIEKRNGIAARSSQTEATQMALPAEARGEYA
jgi:lipoate-protein ligase A